MWNQLKKLKNPVRIIKAITSVARALVVEKSARAMHERRPRLSCKVITWAAFAAGRASHPFGIDRAFERNFYSLEKK